MRNRIFKLILALIYTSVSSLSGQQQQLINKSLQDSLALLKSELIQMKSENESISTRLDSLIDDFILKKEQEEAENDLKKLLDEANKLSVQEKEKEEDLSVKFQSGVRQQQALNPNISLGGDFFGAVSSSKHESLSEPGDVSYGNNGFFLREVELALESPLDPFTRGKTFISISKEAISIEEAYMEWLNLPLKMNLKLGIFYTEFGPLNRYHDHALPQFDRPRALVNLFSNKGLGGAGLSSSFMLPEILFSDATTLDLTVVRGTNTGDNFSFGNNSMQYSGQFKNYYDISRDSYFEFRLSSVAGRNPSEGNNYSYVSSLGLEYKWVPAGREKYRTFDWKTELFYSSRKENNGTIGSKGFYSSVQNKLNARFWVGGRIGYSELPLDRNQYEWDYTINLDFWQSEFVFTRIQYQYNRRNIAGMDPYPPGALPNDHTIFLQVCWAMGPHKHESY
ncbi:MAG TPA: hypothetical protein DDW27_05615 [Bacteroidales bacterium]|nr:hypothetical protein [Bacteroidales bacterium]